MEHNIILHNNLLDNNSHINLDKHSKCRDNNHKDKVVKDDKEECLICLIDSSEVLVLDKMDNNNNKDKEDSNNLVLTQTRLELTTIKTLGVVQVKELVVHKVHKECREVVDQEPSTWVELQDKVKEMHLKDRLETSRALKNLQHWFVNR